MEEMYLLEDATHRPTQTATSYVDLAAASKALNASATASQGPQGPLKALSRPSMPLLPPLGAMQQSPRLKPQVKLLHRSTRT